MLTGAELGVHQKRVASLNVNGFFDDLLSLFHLMVQKGFLKQINLDMVIVSDDIDDLLQKMKNYQAPLAGKWIDKTQT
jgi:predicted Rossmann-fold nucleotide-binding protein